MHGESAPREQLSPKNLLERVATYLSEQNAAGKENFLEGNLGVLAGLIMGVKPAAAFGNNVRDLKPLKELIQRNGINVEIFGGFLYRPEALRRRIAEEAELAEECGWESALTIEENMAKATGVHESSPQKQALYGFIIGFPGSVLRDFREVREKERQGIPSVNRVFESAESGKDFGSVPVDLFEEDDKKTLKDLSVRLAALYAELKTLNESVMVVRRNRLFKILIDEFKPRIRSLYKRYVVATAQPLTEQEVDTIINSYTRLVEIKSPDRRYSVYDFVVHSDEALNAQDIVSLRTKVAEAFK